MHYQPVSFEPDILDQPIYQIFIVKGGNFVIIKRLFPLNCRYLTPNSFFQDIIVLSFKGKNLRKLHQEPFYIIFCLLYDLFQKLMINVTVRKPKVTQNCPNLGNTHFSCVQEKSNFFHNSLLYFKILENIVLLNIHDKRLFFLDQNLVLN